MHLTQSCLSPGEDSQKESSPFINSDDDGEPYFDGKNMALFEVKKTKQKNTFKRVFAHMNNFPLD